MTDIPGMTSVADRITARLNALGKNPSAVALEAGLGRSSVRDIVVGKVASPRLDTLKKLTGPLDCTLEYLTGSLAELDAALGFQEKKPDSFFDPVEVVDPSRIEIGVFRTSEAETASAPRSRAASYASGARQLVYNDFRLPEHYFALYQIMDSSLEDLHILPGDFLTVAAPREGIVPVKSGTIVVVTRTPTFGDNLPEETSARFVEIIDGDIVLTSKSTNPKYKPIRLSDRPDMEDLDRQVDEYLPNHYYTEHGVLRVEGIVVRVSRQLPV